MHGLGRRKGSNALADLEDKLLAERVRCLVAVLDSDKGIDSLTSKFIRHAHYRGLGDCGMLYQGSLDFGRRETVAAYVDNIVNTAADPVKAVVITACTVTSELHHVRQSILARPSAIWNTYVVTLVHIQVCLHVSLVGSPDSPGHARPRLLESQDTLDVITMDLFSRDRVNNCRLDAKEGERGGTRLGRSNARQWCNDIGTRLSLPVSL